MGQHRTDEQIARDLAEGQQTCRGCGERKPFLAYARSAAMRGGRHLWCRACHKVRYRSGVVWRVSKTATTPQSPVRRHQSAAAVARDLAEGCRTCRRCGLRKPLTDFRRDKTTPTGVKGACKPCTSKAALRPYVYRYKTRAKPHPWRWLTLIVRKKMLPANHRWCGRCQAIVVRYGKDGCRACYARRDRARVYRREPKVWIRVYRTARAISGVAVLMAGKKECAGCGVVKPLRGFSRKSAAADGRAVICRVCEDLRSYAWALLDPDDRGVRWLEKERVVSRRAEERRKERRRTDPVERAKYLRKATICTQKRRERKAAAEGFATTAQIRLRNAVFNGICWICERAPATGMDHVKPLAKGGPAWPSNLRPACTRCNALKRDIWPFTRDMIAHLIAA